MENKTEIATLAGGCFWCTEAVFRRLIGVKSAKPGYAGGSVENPTSEQVSGGNTGHAEAIRIEFDPGQISYETILEIFWHTHDPTTLNRQGNDIGSQYRSAIFYHSEKQKETAIKSKEKANTEKIHKNPIVTEITEFNSFYPAEAEHLEYYEKNRMSPYCIFVVDPKIRKLLEQYNSKVKKEFK